MEVKRHKDLQQRFWSTDVVSRACYILWDWIKATVSVCWTTSTEILSEYLVEWICMFSSHRTHLFFFSFLWYLNLKPEFRISQYQEYLIFFLFRKFQVGWSHFPTKYFLSSSEYLALRLFSLLTNFVICLLLLNSTTFKQGQITLDYLKYYVNGNCLLFHLKTFLPLVTDVTSLDVDPKNLWRIRAYP